MHMCSQYRNDALKSMVSKLLKYTYLYTVILVSLGTLLLRGDVFFKHESQYKSISFVQQWIPSANYQQNGKT